MKLVIKKVIKYVAFILILVTSLFTINQMLEPQYDLSNTVYPTTASYNKFYEMEPDTVDVLFLGSSMVVNAFSPQVMYDEYGIRSFNLGSEQQGLLISYFWLKEALQYQSPKVVVLDTRFLFMQHPENPMNTTEGVARKSIDPMKLSPVKVEAIDEICALDTEQSKLSYYLTNLRFHDRWEELNHSDIYPKENGASDLLGFSTMTIYGTGYFETFKPMGLTDEMAETHEAMEGYLDRIVALCKENDITLVLISLPGTPMDERINNTLVHYADVNGLDYINFCEDETFRSIGVDEPKELVIEHSNLWGAIRLSKFMGEILKEDYDVPSVQDAQYDACRAYFEKVVSDAEAEHAGE